MPSMRGRTAAAPAVPLRLGLPYLVLLLLVLADVLTGPSEPVAASFGAASLVAAVVGGPRPTCGRRPSSAWSRCS
jgi:hypothetical protein